MGTRTRNFANNILSGGTIDGTDFLSGAVAAPNIANSSAVNVDSIPSISNVISPVAGDPPSPALGDIWYNSVAKKLRYEGLGVASWATGGNMSTARYFTGGVGIQTAALAIGGYTPPSNTTTTATEEYNGSAWTSGGSMGTSRYRGHRAGIQTAALYTGGEQQPGSTRRSESEEYNGSTWTAVNSMTSPNELGWGDGTTSAAFIVGVAESPTAYGQVYYYDGTSWAAGTDIPDSSLYRGGSSGGGTQTAGLIYGGKQAGGSDQVATTYEGDGSTWTSVNSMGTARYDMAGGGSQTSNLCFGGGVNPLVFKNTTESYDGTSWSSTSNLSTAITRNGGDTSSNTSAVSFGGGDNSPAVTAQTEEFTGASGTPKNFSND